MLKDVIDMSIKIKTTRLVAFMLAVALVFGTVPTSNIITTASAEETSLPTGDLAPITGIRISEYSTSGFGMKFFDWLYSFFAKKWVVPNKSNTFALRESNKPICNVSIAGAYNSLRICERKQTVRNR